MVIDWSEVSAIATVIYGGATLLLVVQIWRDRVQRDRPSRRKQPIASSTNFAAPSTMQSAIGQDT